VPFVSWVDGNNRLWLEEYAQLPVSRGDRTINGHIFAMFGLWDAVELTANPEAERLFRGAAATIRTYVYNGVRRTFWISSYCLRHGVLSTTYHHTVIGEFLLLHAITGNVDWARYADRFRDDYPQRDVTGSSAVRGWNGDRTTVLTARAGSTPAAHCGCPGRVKRRPTAANGSSAGATTTE